MKPVAKSCVVASLMFGTAMFLVPVTHASDAYRSQNRNPRAVDSRSHTVEHTLKDISAANERSNPSISRTPARANCGLCDKPAELPVHDQDRALTASEASASSLHRLRREAVESRGPHDRKHVVDDSLDRLSRENAENTRSDQ